MNGLDRNVVLEKMLAGAGRRLEYRKAHATSRSGKYYAGAIKNYYEQVKNAGEEGKPLAWTSLFIPVELLYAMGIVPFVLEQYVVQFMAQELQELARYLEDRTGSRLDLDKLEEILEISRQTDYYFHLTHQLRKPIPSPLRAREAFSAFALRFYCEGLPETLEFFKAQYEETRDKVEHQQGGLPEERLRIAWFGLYPFFSMKLIDWMEDKYKTSVAADMMNLLPFEENPKSFPDPWEALAWNRLNFMGLRCCLPYEGFKEDMINSCREMNLDGFIFFANFGCKQISNFFMLLRKDLSKELGLPILVITGDPLDPRITSAHQIKSLLDEYFKTLEAKTSKVRKG